MSRLFWFAAGAFAAYYVLTRPKTSGPVAQEGLTMPWAAVYPEGSPRECYAIAKGPGIGRQCFDRCKQTFAPPQFCVEDL